jgi:hypothetical protein
MLLWMRSRANRAEHRRRFRVVTGGVNSCAGSETIVVLERVRMSAVNHQFRLAVRLAETFASASKSLSGWAGKLAKSNAGQVARARQIVGKAAIV